MKCEIHESADGQWYWKQVNSGNTVASAMGYNSMRNAMRALHSHVIANFRMALTKGSKVDDVEIINIKDNVELATTVLKADGTFYKYKHML